MTHDVISTCPVCSGELSITRLHCGSCGTTLEGDFSVGRFGRLNREQVVLLESFLRSRGNLREMERELGISYPTVRGRVDALVRALGFGDGAGAGPEGSATEEEFGADFGDAFAPAAAAEPVDSADVAAERRAILERLARKEIDAEAAAAALRSLGGAG